VGGRERGREGRRERGRHKLVNQWSHDLNLHLLASGRKDITIAYQSAHATTTKHYRWSGIYFSQFWRLEF
jgi:hypothetical protein